MDPSKMTEEELVLYACNQTPLNPLESALLEALERTIQERDEARALVGSCGVTE